MVAGQPPFISVVCNDRMGKKVSVKCDPKDTVGDFKLLLQAQIGTTAARIQLKRGTVLFRDHITLEDYEIVDGSAVELYYS